jgi:hypothetical protein
MSFSLRKLHRHALGGATFLLALSLMPLQGQAQRDNDASPFAGLTGTWSGTGAITLANGSTERIRCRSAYAIGGDGHRLQQNLRCASDSYRFDLTSDVEYNEGGAITGRWIETTRNATGSLTGRASSGQIQARVDSPGFSANLTVTTRGNRQSVTIESQGELRGVSITLNRASS